MLHFRENTAEVILRMLDEATDPWGIKVDFQFLRRTPFPTSKNVYL